MGIIIQEQITAHIKKIMTKMSNFTYPDIAQLNADTNKVQGMLEMAKDLKLISKSKEIDLEADLDIIYINLREKILTESLPFPEVYVPQK